MVLTVETDRRKMEVVHYIVHNLFFLFTDIMDSEKL